MIDLAKEQGIGLSEATKLYPSCRNGRPTHISTPLRHITKGVRLSNGVVVRLEGARLGSRWITSVEAVQRFMERLTAGALESATGENSPPVRTFRQRRRELDRVDRELDKAGF
jgi:hypothetical protein